MFRCHAHATTWSLPLLALLMSLAVPGRGAEAPAKAAAAPAEDATPKEEAVPAAEGDALEPAPSGWAGLGINAKMSTLGYGGEAVARSRWLGLRVGANGYHRTMHGTLDDVRYRLDFRWHTPSAILDVFPFGGSFRLSGGGMLNDNRIALTATPDATYAIGETEYSAADLGSLAGRLEFRRFSPYAGLGWDVPLAPGKHLLMVLDLGVLFQGDPRVTLASSGPLATDETFQANLRIEEANVEKELRYLRYYPVLGLGFSLRF